MNKNNNDSIIKLTTISKIESQPDKTYNKYPKNKYKRINEKSLGYGIIVEKRFPKVKADESKLYGTSKNHKYY